MIVFPIRTDRRLTSTPWVNYALIAANVVVFLFTYSQIARANTILSQLYQLQQAGPFAPAEMTEKLLQELDQITVLHYYLQPTAMHVHQFLTYQFLHADWMHLLANMVFLYVFGNSVEDRLGKVGYALFYLAAGVFAALGHVLFQASPVLGASGSVAGVTGAFLALFPLSNVTIAYWFFIIGAFEVSSLVLILFRVAQDALFQLWQVGQTAYMAHLAGYAIGFVLGMALLVSRILPREPYDMLALIEHRRRRERFRHMTRDGFQPWEHPPIEPGGTPSALPAPPPSEPGVMNLRSKINAALERHELTEAANLYAELLDKDARQVMGQQQQLDLANQLMAQTRYDTAATAYELFLEQYGAYAQRQHIQLILGLIYARYLEQRERARGLLTEALERLDGEDRNLANTVLGEIDEAK